MLSLRLFFFDCCHSLQIFLCLDCYFSSPKLAWVNLPLTVIFPLNPILSRWGFALCFKQNCLNLVLFRKKTLLFSREKLQRRFLWKDTLAIKFVFKDEKGKMSNFIHDTLHVGCGCAYFARGNMHERNFIVVIFLAFAFFFVPRFLVVQFC